MQAINGTKIEKAEILLFDRGISKAQTFESFSQNEQYFVTRVNINRKYVLIQTNTVSPNEITRADSNEELYKDLNIRLLSKLDNDVE
ncbi:hypothetical protein [Candidatus Tisiphia endosymbiont of Dioctria rufipes]|uniref:hypothetical protein n=1 Tax=Candidatus Tisiphia endosymbiont of Dioctria rufipes TaxID=3066255 RepID=UPI00312C9598